MLMVLFVLLVMLVYRLGFKICVSVIIVKSLLILVEENFCLLRKIFK